VSYNSNTHLRYKNDDYLLSPILPNFLRTTSHLNCLINNGSYMDWNTLDCSLTSAFLHFMHLPTINHISLSFIYNFPLSSLTSSVNLHRLDIFDLKTYLKPPEEDGSPGIVEMMSKVREFRTSESTLLTPKLLHYRRSRYHFDILHPVRR
jgi:hypothetical protein